MLPQISRHSKVVAIAIVDLSELTVVLIHVLLDNFLVVTLVISSGCLLLRLRLGSVLFIRAETIIEGIQVECVAVKVFNNHGHAALKIYDALTQALLHGLLLYWVDFRVNFN